MASESEKYLDDAREAYRAGQSHREEAHAAAVRSDPRGAGHRELAEVRFAEAAAAASLAQVTSVVERMVEIRG